ncbi:MAG: hypothetical protein IK130_01525 [Oscillospiraceae bacterium]|nr:hypothetical protein [Oscillospiraceae bacterium]
MNKNICRLLSGVLAAGLLFPCTVSAAGVRVLVGYRGDINGDLCVDAADAAILAQYLAGEPTEGAYAWEYADLDAGGTLDAADLTLLKRLILSGGEPEAVYRERTLIDPPISAVNPPMPTSGAVKIPVFAVSFPDCTHAEDAPDVIRETLFGEADPDSEYYPLESIPAYYQRASGGALEITGEVYTYTAKNPLAYYDSKKEALTDEVMGAMDAEIDYQDYDSNGDRRLDAVILLLPEKALERDVNGDGTADWWMSTLRYVGRKSFDRVKTGKYCIGAVSLGNHANLNSTCVHELGHVMGLPDYYKYTKDETGRTRCMYGSAGLEMMDDAFGDFCAFSRLMLGWFTEEEIQVYSGGVQTFTLTSMQQSPSCVIVPRGDLNGYHSEFFIIEYATPEENNRYYFTDKGRREAFSEGGIRILHCESEIAMGTYGAELKYYNLGKYYDKSNMKQRVLRMVECVGGDFFRTGSTVDSHTTGFQWYDDDGAQTEDPGVCIRIEELIPGNGTDPLRGSRYQITISEN